MKFIRQEKVITTVSSQDISDQDEARSFLEDLKKEHLKFSVIIRKTFNSENNSTTIHYQNATIKRVCANEDSVDLYIFNKSGSINMRVGFEDIVEIRALTNRNDFLKYGKKISKFDVMDI